MIGFGARRIFDDDRIDAKYLNTPETPIYKKSHVLYGIDLARRDIARASQAVVVEGYTDVMACHLAGVPTAVATCGTAFGDDHGRVLRRLLQDHDEFRGEVIFTFDGDAAGQKAALRAFEGDQNFAGQTYVAVEPDGLDPCDLRLQHGDAAVRELVARRIPLYRFVLAQRRRPLRPRPRRRPRRRAARGGRLVSAIRDRSKVEAFSRELAGMVGVDVDDARAEVARRAAPPRRASSDPSRLGARPRSRAASQQPPRPARPAVRPGARDAEARRAAPRGWSAARPRTSTPTTSPIPPTARSGRRWSPAAARPTLPTARCGSPSCATASTEPALIQALSALGRRAGVQASPTTSYAAQHVYRLQEVTALRRIADVKSKLQRTNPVESPTEYNRMFGDLVALEQHRARAAREGDRRRRVTSVPRRREGARRRAGACPPLPRRAGARERRRRRRHLAARHPRRPRDRRRGRRDPGAVGAGRDRRLGPRRGAAAGRRGGRVRARAPGAHVHGRRAATAAAAGARAGHGQRGAPAPGRRRAAAAASWSSPGAPRAATARSPGRASTTRASTPTTPTVRLVVDEALAAAQGEVGPGPVPI